MQLIQLDQIIFKFMVENKKESTNVLIVKVKIHGIWQYQNVVVLKICFSKFFHEVFLNYIFRRVTCNDCGHVEVKELVIKLLKL